MKLLKYLFILILMLLLAASAYVAILEGEYEIEKEIRLKSPRELVFKEVNQLNNWEHWSAIPASASSQSFSEITEGEHASYHWTIDSLKMTGKLENIKVEKISHIHQKAAIEKSIGKTQYDLQWNFQKDEDSTRVHLILHSRLNFGAKLLKAIQKEPFEENLAGMAEKDLNRLKQTVLEQMEIFSINVDGVKNMPEQAYVYTSISSKNNPELLIKERTKAFDKLTQFLDEAQKKASSSGFTLYNNIDRNHDNVIVSFGIPVNIDKDILLEDSENNILMGLRSEQKVVKSTLKGNYTNIPKLWEATRVYMQENRLQQNPDLKAYEVYKITSKDSENPAEWLTELYVPIQESEVRLNLEKELEL